ncbi:calcium-binding protein [Shimia sp.]|uniref:calcium-binding protein n=1 Tax=Shimia sp. TaxID=1954381 RepID=UPI003298932F
MPGFTVYETNGTPLSEKTLTIDVGAFGEIEAQHSIAILYDTVRLQFGEAYETGAGTQVFRESAVSEAWVEYSYTYAPDPRLLELKEALESAQELQEINIETDTAESWENYWVARNAYVSLFNQAMVNGLNPQIYLDLESYINENGQPEGFASGTYIRYLSSGSPSGHEFSGVDIEMFGVGTTGSFAPEILNEGQNSDFIAVDSNFWTVSDSATIHVTFEESQLEEFLNEGHVLEGDRTPSNSVLVVVEHDADWSILSSHEVNGYSPENLEDTIRVLNTFSDYIPPEDPEVTAYIDEVIVDIPSLQDMGIEFTSDERGTTVRYETSEYFVDANGHWETINTQSTLNIEGDNLDSYYSAQAEATTSGLFELFRTHVENLGLRAFSSYFTGTDDAAELAVDINTIHSDPLLRVVDSLDSFDPEEMQIRIDNIRNSVDQLIENHVPWLTPFYREVVFSGRHSSFSYQMTLDPSHIPQGDSHSNRVVFGATGATYHAGAGSDYLFGNVGADMLFGDDGEDVLSGGGGNDSLEGGAGGDWISGGVGQDTLISEADHDLADGGAGDDLIRLGGTEHYSNNFVAFNVSSDTQVGTQVRVNLEGMVRIEAVVDGGGDADVIELSEMDDAFFLHDAYSGFHDAVELTEDYIGNESAARFTNIEEIRAMGGDDIIDLTSPDYSLAGAYLYVDGGDGNDIIWGSDADEFIYGGDGDDTIFGGIGLDVLSGGFGSDVFEFTRTSTDVAVIDFDIADGDVLRFYNTDGAEFDASSAALISGGMIIYYTDITTGTSHSLAIALEGPLSEFSATLPELVSALEII